MTKAVSWQVEKGHEATLGKSLVEWLQTEMLEKTVVDGFATTCAMRTSLTRPTNSAISDPVCTVDTAGTHW